MNGFTKAMDKMKPKFEKIAANPYVSAVRDGFIAAMPIILFSSLFTLIAYCNQTRGDFIGRRQQKTHWFCLIAIQWVCLLYM